MTTPRFEFDPELLVEDADDDYIDDGHRTPEPEPIDIGPGERDVQAPAFQQPLEQPEAESITGGRKTRPAGALKYEKKIRRSFSTAIKMTAGNPKTVPDSAAMILTAPRVSRALGDLAAEDKRIARGIDLITEGTDSIYLQAFLALSPLVGQVIRNHETTFEPKVRGVRIPIVGWRVALPFKLGITLSWLHKLRAATEEPNQLAAYVFDDPAVKAAFEAQHIPVAWQTKRR